jgi:CRISPR-associated protein Csm1
MLGPWDQVLRFSRRVRKEFSQFTCNNPDFTLSAGVAVVKPRLPIYAAIGYAEDLLGKAKDICTIGANEPKNQFAVLGDIITNQSKK